MSSWFLPLLVILQIVVFQFAAAAFMRNLVLLQTGPAAGDPRAGAATGPDPSSRIPILWGLALLVVVAAAVAGLHSHPEARKLVLAAASIASSAAFAMTSVRDRRRIRARLRERPEHAIRRASLRPRAVFDWYRKAWELVPAALCLATLAFSTAMARRPAVAAAELWIVQIAQVAFVLGALMYTLRHGDAVPVVSRRLPAFRDDPEAALRFGELLAAKEMRYFVLAKSGVTLLLGLWVVRIGTQARDEPAAALGAAIWLLVLALLVVFGSFAIETGRLIRPAAMPSGQPSPPSRARRSS